MPLYFGRPGGMVTLPDPDPKVPMTPVRRSAEHITLGGARTVDIMGHPRWDYTFKWTRLQPAELQIMEEFHSGSNGPGPWWLLPVDMPGWNFLHPVTAAATSLTGDTAGWSTDSSHTVTSVTAPVLRGPRALQWHAAAHGDDRWLWIDGFVSPQDLPLADTGPWTFTFNTRTLAGSAVVFAQLFGLAYHDGPDTTINASGWTPVTVTYSPPAGEDLGMFIGARPGPAADIVIDTPRLTYGTGIKPWAPGRGVPRVAITDLAITAAWINAYDVTMTLREVG